MKLYAAACAAALLTFGPSAAQSPVPPPPVATPPIPAVQSAPYPGVIRIEVDATDVERRIMRVRQTIPVARSGPLTLLYPEYLPGNHASTGPIQLVSGVTVTSGGGRIEWRRDPVQPHAFHLDVPAGVADLVVEFQWLTQPDPAQWRVVMTPEMLNLQWEKALLYPAGYVHRNITFAPSVRLPEGWRYGVALDTQSFTGGVATFAPVSLETLVDSPMFAGRHYRQADLDPGGRSPVRLHIVADTPADLAATDEQIGRFRALVDQSDRLFGARHYDRYDFLLALSAGLGGIGLEHHRSSENAVGRTLFTDWNSNYGARGLLPHEYVHSWNGKFRRPADQMTANFNEPLRNSLLWVYEGQTEYWGEVLTARSGLATREEALASLATTAAFYENQPGRQWRALQDTTNHNLLGYRVPNPWPSWMRGTGDYYNEAQLIWLDADTLIREQTRGRRSLDDFARGFFGVDDGVWTPRPYTFEDLVAALNAVHPHDWTRFLRSRLDAVGPDARAPLDGVTRGGYRLVYVDTLNDVEKRIQSGWANDFQYSLGFTLSGGAENRITGVRWGGQFYQQGLGAGWSLVAVNDRAASAEVLRQAITAAKAAPAPLRLILRNGERFRTVEMTYRGGLRYPRLERVAGTPDRLGDILSPRR